jgi:hypothetical protein
MSEKFMKAPILSFFEHEGQGHGIISGAPWPPPLEFFLRSWRPCEVDEIKNECFISNLHIPGFHKSKAFD